MHRLTAAALLALLSAFSAQPALAQAGAPVPVFLPIVSNHDYDSASVTYCVLGAQLNSDTQGVAKITTSGSSATVTAVTGTPFDNIAAGSEISVNPAGSGAGGAIVLYVIAKASGSSITVNRAVTLGAGTSWSWRNLACGTGANAGWFPVAGIRDKNIVLQINQLSLASGHLDVTMQCKGSSPWATGIPVYPPVGGTGQCGLGQFTAADGCGVVLFEPWAKCRVGVTLTDDVGDTGANLEQVTVYLEGLK